MAELVARIDAPLSEHLAAQGVEFMQFAFRWMNCLLMREISVKNTVRMWDTYLVRPCSALDERNEDEFLCRYDRRKVRMPFLSFTCTCVQRFSPAGAKSSAGWTFRYVGVCHCSIVFHHSRYLIQGIIMFLQSLPTQDWTDHEIEMLLSQAFVLNSIWHNAQSHFTGK
jgi:TBC1 domain family member 2